MAPYRWFTFSLLRSISLDLLLLSLATIFLLRLASRLVLVVRRRANRDFESGSGVMEFVLLTPLLLTTMLAIFQIVLIVQAKFVVNYAAFCAVRSAIVLLPSSVQSTVTGKIDHFNQINTEDPSSPKMAIIRRAAAIACTAISPPWGVSLATGTGIIPSTVGIVPMGLVGAFFPGSIAGMDVPEQLVLRNQYAMAPDVTTVQVTIQPVHSAETFNDVNYGMVTVHLIYRYYLTVPIAGKIFGTGFLGFFGPAFYIPINEQYTLPSEMDPIFPANQQPPEQFDLETFE